MCDAERSQYAVTLAESAPNPVLAFIAGSGADSSRTDLPSTLRVSAARAHRPVLEAAALPHRPHLVVEATVRSRDDA